MRRHRVCAGPAQRRRLAAGRRQASGAGPGPAARDHGQEVLVRAGDGERARPRARGQQSRRLRPQSTPFHQLSVCMPGPERLFVQLARTWRPSCMFADCRAHMLHHLLNAAMHL